LSAEIIISDNCSTDETPRAWQDFQNDKWPVRYRRNQENLGYLRNANAGAGEARGSFLCLMNNDVIVQPGWLDAMVDVLRENEDVGLVGPKYISAQGKVVECGSAIFSDGTAVQLGNGTSIDDPHFSYLNDVHYCSMACVVLRNRLFREMGGYDERYVPAYYEDVDLCFRIADRSLRVVVNPLVCVTHLFGGSHNLQETVQLMDKNRLVLRERWKERLERLHPQPGTPPARLRSWPRGSTIVFHWSFIVNPDSTTGSLRNWRLLMEARRRGHHIVYVGENQPVERLFLDILRKRGIEVRDHVIGLERDLVRELASAHSISAAVMSFGVAEERYGHVYDLIDPEIVRIFDTVDVHFIRELRSRQDNASWGAIQRIEIGCWCQKQSSRFSRETCSCRPRNFTWSARFARWIPRFGRSRAGRDSPSSATVVTRPTWIRSNTSWRQSGPASVGSCRRRSSKSTGTSCRPRCSPSTILRLGSSCGDSSSTLDPQSRPRASCLLPCAAGRG
jgi:GT2 family glycosyltransferase